MVNRDLVDEYRPVEAQRPTWMPGEQPVDPLRAALVRAGRRQTLWRRIRGGAPPRAPPAFGRLRSAMTLSLTYDHRAMDGTPASKFLADLKVNLENFTLLLANG